MAEAVSGPVAFRNIVMHPTTKTMLEDDQARLAELIDRDSRIRNLLGTTRQAMDRLAACRTPDAKAGTSSASQQDSDTS